MCVIFVVHTLDMTTQDKTGYTVDSTAGAWPHQLKFTLPGYLITYLVSPSVRVVLSVILIPGLLCLMDK